MSVVPMKSNRVAEVGVVQAASERIKLRMKRTAEDIVAIGLDLQEIKDNLPHGEFLPWVEAEFGMTDRAARKFIEVGKRYGSKSEIISDLSPTVLYELSAPSTPEPVRQVIEAKAEKGEVVSVKEVQDLKRRMKEQCEADEKKLKALSAENQALKDSQELARIKAQEEAAKAVEADLAGLRDEKLKIEAQLKAAQKEAKAAASKEAEAIIKQKMAEKEEDLKKLREKAREAQSQLDNIERKKSNSAKRLEELEAQANKISSVDWEAKSFLKELDDLAGKMTQVLLTVQGLEHEHNESTLKVAQQTALMCENLAVALRMTRRIDR